MKSIFAAAVGLSLALFSGGESSLACSCMGNPPEQLYKSHDAVFRGTPLSYVVSDEFGEPTYIYSFQVTACWKGDVDGVIEVRSEVNEAICGVFIPPGSDVLIYAELHSGHYHGNLCTVFSAAGADEHFKWLGEPTCSPVSVEGNS